MNRRGAVLTLAVLSLGILAQADGPVLPFFSGLATTGPVLAADARGVVSLQLSSLVGPDTIGGVAGVIRVIGLESDIFQGGILPPSALVGPLHQSPIVIDKNIDRTTPELINAALRPIHFTSATLRFYRPNVRGEPRLYFQMQLTNVAIAGHSLRQVFQGVGGGFAHLEELSLEVSRITWTFDPLGEHPVMRCWDFMTNTPC